MSDFLKELEWRGALEDVTDREALSKALDSGPVTLYAGFDPTASSLHVGNLVPIVGLVRFQRAGHRPIALAGGATGMIGDPSGKSAERQFLTEDLLQENLVGIRGQLEKFLDFSEGLTQAILTNNYDWFGGIGYIQFLREVGKTFSVNRMIQKESVKARLEQREQGISYTEFSYMLLQAYDFLHLYREHGCALQIGGSDQWGNITAGIDLIRRQGAGDATEADGSKQDGQAFGLCMPLLTNSSGKKFGKSESGENIWLDPERTSPYKFYQFWLRSEDADVVRYLKFWTFLGREEIHALAAVHEEKPEAREAHAVLAREVTAFVHGKEAAEAAARASKALFGGGLGELQSADWAMLAGEVPSSKIEKARLEGDGFPLLEALVEGGLADSKGAARRDLKSGAISINDAKANNRPPMLTTDDLRAEKYIMLRRGKANYHLLICD